MAQTVHSTVTWAQGLVFDGRTGSGHQVRLDSERQAGASPMELMLTAMGACSSVDVVIVLRQAEQDVRGCQCVLSATRAEQDPKVFTKIHAHFVVSGRGLDAATIEHAIRLSAERLGSGWIMLSKTAEITHDFELVSS